MQETDIHIAHMLAANALKNYEGTLDAIRMFLDGRLVETLRHRHWNPQKDKPEEGTVFMKIGDEYWVQEGEYFFVKPHEKNTQRSGSLFPILCKECDTYMTGQYLTTCKKANPKGWRTRFECSNPHCLHEIYTKADLFKINSYEDIYSEEYKEVL